MRKLENVRNDIDKVDKEIMQLIHQRLQYVGEVGAIKEALGLPVYAPDREKEMLNKRRNEAKQMGLNPNLIEDVLRRIMRQSYDNEYLNGFHCKAPSSNKKIVIIGKNGQIGSLFAKMFEASGYTVFGLDRDDWVCAERILSNALMVMISVPIHDTINVIKQAAPFLSKDTLLTDVTSIKKQPVESMLKHHTGPVLGLHPMFGPDVTNLAKQLILQTPGRSPESSQWLLEQINLWGCQVQEVDKNQHDTAMLQIQMIRHFSTLLQGLHLCKQNINIAELKALSSPIYRLELMMTGRLFAQDPNLYADILLSYQDSAKDLLSAYQDDFNDLIATLKKGDKTQLIDYFKKIKQHFGIEAQEALQESKSILAKAKDGYA